MDFDAGVASRAAIGAVEALLARVFPAIPRLDRAWLEWGYLGNPLGPAIVADARDGDRIVAHIAGRPLLAQMRGFAAPIRGVLVHHAATDASYRRRGLLAQVVERMLARASEDGALFAIAVLNQNSVASFVNRIGFTNLRPLSVRIGVGPLARAQSEARDLDFAPLHATDWLAWRLAAPGAPYREQRLGETCAIWAGSGLLGTPVLLGDVPLSTSRLPPLATRSPLRAWIGLDPARSFRGRPFLEVPLALRPSPLHLVFRSLTSEIGVPSAERLRFAALDFDAW